MPSATLPQRRRRGQDSEYGIQNGTSSLSASSSHPRSTKKARLTIEGDSSPSQRPLLPDGYLSQSNTTRQLEPFTAHTAPEEYQPGSIVRVKLSNFVTYTAAEFRPGPSLNMVIGPNGTGKSTLVCAICLGLGWGPQHLGRAKEVSEYVKHGSQEAFIEIELARDERRHSSNPIICCNIKREGSKSLFSINSKPSNKKSVVELAKSFSIQIDNLCQFLPQDKVVEFAAMTPIELLRSTQRAVARQEMLDWHDELKTLRGQQRIVQAQDAADQEALANLEGRQRMQEADVKRMREKELIKERIGLLEASRPFAEYRSARTNHLEAKEKKTIAMAELKRLTQRVEPALQAVNTKEQYREQTAAVVDERKQHIDRAIRNAQDCAKRVNALDDEIKELNSLKTAEKTGSKQSKQEANRQEQAIANLKKQMERQPVELDASSYNERIREKKRASARCLGQARELQKSMRELLEKGRDKNTQIEQAKKDLKDLESQEGQQNKKLATISRDTAQAWKWVQEHQGEFEKPVYGPAIVECSVKDSKYVNLIESLFNKTDFTAFTVQTKGDYKKLSKQLYGHMRLVQINIRTMVGGLDNFPPPTSEQNAQRYGFEGWALDYLSGPEPILAMLCAEGPRLNQTGIALRDTITQQYEMLQDSSISTWVTSKSFYKISRRREYGPGATSTQVRDTKQARIWTDQPVDVTAKRELEENINGWREEIEAMEGETAKQRQRVSQLRDENKALEDESTILEGEKCAKQKAISDFSGLPIKLSQQEIKLATIHEYLAGVRARYQALQDREDAVILDKAQAALDYANAVQGLRNAHASLHEAELVLIEVNSDVEVLTEQNSAVKTLLKTKEGELDGLNKSLKDIAGKATQLLNSCIALNSDPVMHEFVRQLPEGQTIEELETEIESDKARLDLMHEGNGGIIRDFEQRQKKIDTLKAKLEEVKHALDELDGKLKDIKDRWEPELDRLVKNISASFAFNMRQINCAGEVGIYKDEQEFDQWAIQIQVKFRESEPLTLLDSHRQSGGERAVSTIFYLMSLQSLTRSPFRVVDEINQGMDPRNERLVHARMVSIATGNDLYHPHHDELVEDLNSGNGNGDIRTSTNARVGRSQYFLITPKLLHGLKYERGMRILCIASGENMPVDQQSVDFRSCVDVRKRLRNTASIAAAAIAAG